MSHASSDAVDQLAGTLPGQPPSSLASVEPAVVRHLAEAVTAESRRQQDALGRAVEDALRLVPRPLRGLVRKVIRP